jgi:hypothetical protein
VYGGVFGWMRSWELGWDGHCNRMLEVAGALYAWGSLCLGVSILGALYIEEKYGESTLRVKIRVRARRVWRNGTMKSDGRGLDLCLDGILQSLQCILTCYCCLIRICQFCLVDLNFRHVALINGESGQRSSSSRLVWHVVSWGYQGLQDLLGMMIARVLQALGLVTTKHRTLLQETGLFCI